MLCFTLTESCTSVSLSSALQLCYKHENRNWLRGWWTEATTGLSDDGEVSFPLPRTHFTPGWTMLPPLLSTEEAHAGGCSGTLTLHRIWSSLWLSIKRATVAEQGEVRTHHWPAPWAGEPRQWQVWSCSRTDHTPSASTPSPSSALHAATLPHGGAATARGSARIRSITTVIISTENGNCKQTTNISHFIWKNGFGKDKLKLVTESRQETSPFTRKVAKHLCHFEGIYSTLYCTLIYTYQCKTFSLNYGICMKLVKHISSCRRTQTQSVFTQQISMEKFSITKLHTPLFSDQGLSTRFLNHLQCG